MDRRDYNNEEREDFNNDRGYTPRSRRFNFSRSDYQNTDANGGFASQQPAYTQQPVYPQQPQQFSQPQQPYGQGYVPVQPVQSQPMQSQPGTYQQLPQGFQPQQYNNPPYSNPYYAQDGGFDYDGRMPQPEMQQGKKKGLFGFKGKKQTQFVQGDMQNILIVAPKTLSEVQDIIDNLRNRQAIIVEFNKINEKYAQRILDFLNGAIYALGGCEQRIAENMFLFTPGGVSIQGPSSLKNRF